MPTVWAIHAQWAALTILWPANVSGQLPLEEWLAIKREEAKVKKRLKELPKKQTK